MKFSEEQSDFSKDSAGKKEIFSQSQNWGIDRVYCVEI